MASRVSENDQASVPPVRWLPESLVEAESAGGGSVATDPPSVAEGGGVSRPARANVVIRAIWAIGSGLEWLFGVASLIAGLALLATVPLAQFLSLGYLLEVSGRIARTGRVRDGWVGVRKAARVGSIVLGTWLVLWPARFASSMWYSAWLIDPDGQVTARWRLALWVLVGITSLHVLWAWYRGGRLRHFLWPAPLKFIRWLRQPHKYRQARDATWDYVTSLRLPYYFRVGLVGFLASLAWLFIPVTLLIGGTTLEPPAAVLSGLAGGVLFALVVAHLPFLQAHAAAEQRWRAWTEASAVWQVYYRSPWVCLLALVVTLAFALPLYLLKIEWTPRQVAFLPALLFVIFMFPSRILQGWAVARARWRPAPRHPGRRVALCLFTAVLASPALAAYVLAVFATRYTSWHGVWSLFEQHAFLLPVPF